MSKELIVAAGIAALAQAQSDAFGVCFDSSFAEGVASVPPSIGGLSQADVDAQVKAQSDADAAALAQSQAADQVAQASAVAAVQAQLDQTSQALADMTAKDKTDSAAALALKASVAGIQAALDALNAIIAPPSDPVPAPDAPSAA